MMSKKAHKIQYRRQINKGDCLGDYPAENKKLQIRGTVDVRESFGFGLLNIELSN